MRMRAILTATVVIKQEISLADFYQRNYAPRQQKTM